MPDIESLKRAPNNIDAEKAILGNIIIDPASFESVSFLKREDFYIDEHKVIFDAIADMANKGQEIDTITLVDALTKLGTYTSGDASRYIKLLVDSATNTNIVPYATIVQEKSLLRQLIDASKQISDSAYSEIGPVADILDKAESAIYAVSNQKYSHEFSTIHSLLTETYQILQHRMNNPNEKFGIQSNFEELDSTLVGFGPGDLVIIGARPGMGKTSFAMNIACNVAKSMPDRAVAVFSLEMDALQLASRLLASEALVPGQQMLDGKLTDSDWQRLADASSALSKTRIFINDSSEITVSEMRSKLRKIENLSLVVIDYLQLMHDSRYSENRVLEVAQITRSLKIMAKEFQVPVLLCSQLSRPPRESREAKKPALTDLRDSGAIEQDADIVMFLYREDYYNENSDKRNIVECDVKKNRHGRTDKVQLRWMPDYTSFETLETRYEE